MVAVNANGSAALRLALLEVVRVADLEVVQEIIKVGKRGVAIPRSRAPLHEHPQFEFCALSVVTMPSNTNADMMLTLAADNPLPFTDSDTWQAITGLDVVPFSDDCTPKAIRMDAVEYPGAKSAFDAYKLKNKAHKRRDFLAGQTGEEESFHTPGCKSLKAWVKQNWSGWRLAATTKQVLMDKRYDFYQFHKDRGRKEVSKDEWCMPITLLIFFFSRPRSGLSTWT